MSTIQNPFRRRQIQRERLLQALVHWRSFRLIRVVAPAGFGKSTLAAQWMHTLSSEQASIVYLPLTITDRDVEHFLRRLYDALEGSEPRTHRISAPLPAQDALYGMIARREHPVVVLLDDLHDVDAGPTLAVVQHLLDEGPPNLHLAVFSRTRTRLTTRRWQMQGAMLNLNIDDLRFSHDEFLAFAASSRLGELDAGQLAEVEQRYAGWPAGLQLLLQIMPATQPMTDARIRAAADDEEFLTYLEQDALHYTPEHSRSFLIETALLPYLTAALCAGVRGGVYGECELILAHIADTNGLVTADATAKQDVRYRVHPVLRRFLLRRLSQLRTPDELCAMRRTAANALAEHGDIDAALELLLPSDPTVEEVVMIPLRDDFDAAADIIERSSSDEVWHGNVEAVHRWIGRLPESTLRTRPRLALDAAWAVHHILQMGPRPPLPLMRAALVYGSIDDDARAEALVLEALETLRHGRWRQCAAHLRAARAVCHFPNSRASAYIEGIEACTLLENEPRTLASRLEQLDHACAIFQRIGYIRGYFDALNQTIWVSRNYASGPSVVSRAKQALQSYAANGWQNSLYAIFAHLHISEMQYYMDRIDEARSSIHAAIAAAEAAGLLNILRADIDVRLQLCELAEERSIDENADYGTIEDLSRQQNYVTVGLFANYRRILRDIRLKRYDYCHLTIESMGVDTNTLNDSHQPAIWLCVLAGTLFSDPTNENLSMLLETARRQADALSQRWISMHMLLLQALLAQHEGDDAQAIRILQTLVTDVVRTGMLRVLLDFPQLLPLLVQIDSEEAGFIVSRSSRSRIEAALTAQERRILDALAAGAPTRRIAADLVVSIETVRTHIRNILKKLDVHTLKKPCASHAIGE